MFRLCVRNLPVSWDDKKLRKLFLENAPQNARIKEAKVRIAEAISGECSPKR